ncbi:MAG TPA: trimeric intracellular cation channel family protein [Paludibacteraceae bacterium]|nr:trimeric intracellular cation channel family protein [Paludibacteraceae bacterium]
MNLSFINFIDYLGTFAFAISGMRLASAKRFDWFGAYVVGLVTAIGGGTTRDLLLDVTPFWMLQPSYLIVTGFALLFVIFLGKWVIRLHNTFFIFDAIGLGLFVVVGIDKALELNYPFWVAILMGMITGSVGGVIRDILINEVPLIFRKDIYALACVVGGLIYFVSFKLNFSPVVMQTTAAVSVIVTRVIAVKYHISIPVLKAYEDFKNEKENDRK